MLLLNIDKDDDDDDDVKVIDQRCENFYRILRLKKKINFKKFAAGNKLKLRLDEILSENFIN